MNKQVAKKQNVELNQPLRSPWSILGSLRAFTTTVVGVLSDISDFFSLPKSMMQWTP